MDCINCKFFNDYKTISGYGSCAIELPPWLTPVKYDELGDRIDEERTTFAHLKCDLGEPKC